MYLAFPQDAAKEKVEGSIQLNAQQSQLNSQSARPGFKAPLDYHKVLKNNKTLGGKLKHDRKRLQKACSKNKNLRRRLEEASKKLEKELDNLAFAKR